MTRYFGIIKKENENMIGVDIEIKAKTSKDKKEIENWIKKYPDYKNIIMEYEDNHAKEIESFFEDFEELTCYSEEEKQKAEMSYRKLMSEEE